MDTELLAIFRAVAAHGSFSAAARQLVYTQPTVSRQISALESEFGARLFDRLPRGVHLTEHGRVLLAHAEAVIARVDLARRDLAALDQLEGGRLRVGAFTTATAVLLPRAMATFVEEWPQISLSLVEGISRRLLARLDADEVDLAVVSAFPGQDLDEERFRLTRLLEDTMLVALPPEHPLARRRGRVRLAQLEDQSWIGADASVDDRLLGPARLAQARTSDFLVHEWTAKLGLVAAGLGITLVPSLAAQAARTDVALVPLHPSDAPTRTVYLATARNRTASPASDAFADTLRAIARHDLKRAR
jgi:DNA-binding transcriptional LysR family regulator